MSVYVYKARDKSGQIVEGVLNLPNKRAVIDQLSNQGYYPTEVALQRKFDLFKQLLKQVKSVKLPDTIIFSRQLATMLKAGLTPNRSLNILSEQTQNRSLQKAIRQIQTEVSTGSSFADALSQHPRIFSELYVNTVQVGEESGNLEEVLKRLALYMQSQKELQDRVGSALVYPSVVLVITIGVLGFLVSFVLPKFAVVFARVKVPLPPLTRYLFDFSKFVGAQWLWILTSVGVVITGLFLFSQTRFSA